MPILLPDKKALQKPLAPQIDWRNPLSRGLVVDFPFVGSSLMELIGRISGKVTGVSKWNQSIYGSAIAFDGTGNNFVDYTLLSSQTGLNQITMEMLVYPRDISQFKRPFERGDNFHFEFDDTWGWVFVAGWSGGNAKWSIPKIPINTWTETTVTYDWGSTGNVPKIYQNGVNQTITQRVGPSGNKVNSNTSLRVGSNAGGSVALGAWSGNIAFIRIWNRILTAQEVKQIYTNPFQIYQSTLLRSARYGLQPPLPTVTAETERPTSQIIIDKVYQANVGNGTTLNMQVNIPSQDADLIVTGGSVIATGGAWQSVQLNGTSLTKLVQAGVAGQSAEIWWTSRPGVGVKTLSIVPTATNGQVYANAMVVLGIDNRNQNIITNSTTDALASSTISTSITPDSANCLVVDCLTAVDTLVNPRPDQLQTQIFNPSGINAGENVLSSYKIGSTSQQQMNYSLGTTVNASMVAAVFRPNQSASIWFPNIDTRQISDVVTPNDLDSGITPATGNYGYRQTTLWRNSFLHTVGKITQQPNIDYEGLKSKLVAYYPFYEGQGTVVHDMMNNFQGAWTQTDRGTNHWETKGKINAAGRFVGTNNAGNAGYIIVNNGAILGGQRNSSVSVWFKGPLRAGSGSGMPLYCERAASGNDIYKLEITGGITGSNQIGSFMFTVRNDAATLSQPGSASLLVADNMWHHLVMTKQGNLITLYVDNIVVSSSTVSTTDNFTNTGIISSIGGDAGDSNSVTFGNIDALGLWQRALRSDEVSQLWNNGKGLDFPFSSNQTSIGVQGYNFYSQGNNARAGAINYQNSFLHTIGRLIPSSFYFRKPSFTKVGSITQVSSSTNLSFKIKPQSPYIDWTNPLTNGLTADLLFYEGAGDTIHNLVGQRVFTTQGLPTWVATPAGWGMQFNGINQYAVTNDPIIKFPVTSGGADNFTIEAWAIPHDLSVERVWINVGGARDGFALETTGGTLQILYNTVRRVDTGFAPTNGTLVHFVGIRSSMGTSLYVNGQLKAVQTGVSGPLLPTEYTQIGYQQDINNGSYIRGFDGIIVSIRAWKRALTRTEVEELYAYPYQIEHPAFYKNIGKFVSAGQPIFIWQQLTSPLQDIPSEDFYKTEVVDY